MEKYNILALAPYEGLKRLFYSVASKRDDINLTVYVGDMADGVDIVKELQGNGYDAIISRGGTAEMIEKIAKIPVIKTPLSGYDMLRAIKLAQNYAGKFAIVGFDSITANARLVCELLKYDTNVITVRSREEAEQCLEGLKSSGFSLIVGDLITTTIAKKMSLHSILITSGLESVNAAFNQAVLLCSAFRAEKNTRILAETLYSKIDTHVIAFDQNENKIYSTLSEIQEAAVLNIVKKKIQATFDGNKLNILKSIADTVWSIKSECVVSGAEKYAAFYIAQGIYQATPQDNSIQYQNADDSQLASFGISYDNSEPMRDLVNLARRYSETMLPVLVIGEEGTGKDTVAEAIYANSPLSRNPLFTINCQLMTDKKWDCIFENEKSPLANSEYTIYFKKVNYMSAQTLARIETYINNTSVHKRNRLIFSFILDQTENTEDHPVCRYLMNRLCCLTLRLPSLRDRKACIPSLVSLYLNELNQDCAKQVIGLNDDAMQLLLEFNWKYNYDQLKRVLKELVILTDTPYICADDVKILLRNEDSLPILNGKDLLNNKNTLDDINRDIILSVLKSENMNQTRAAKRLGISRSTLWRKLNE